MDLPSGDVACFSCGQVVNSRIIDEGAEWRTSTVDANDSAMASLSRAADKTPRFGASFTDFIGGSENQRRILQQSQLLATDPRELQVLKHIHIVRDQGSALNISQTIMVSVIP